MSPSQRIVIAGGSGFIGMHLARHLIGRGLDVVILTRGTPRVDGGATYLQWDGRSIGDWWNALDGAAGVINLAGRNVNCRYTRRRIREMDESRVDSVNAVAGAIARCAFPPPVWVQASTTAIYGDAGDVICDESAPPGGDCIPVRTATQWESAFHRAAGRVPGTRRVLLRISFVLARHGGVLETLKRLVRFYLGGRVGSGRQFISWIHIDDLMRVFMDAIEDRAMQGVYNATSPAPVTNAAFMAELRRAMRRPWAPPTPAPLVHLGAFFMRTEAILALTGRRCVPKRLMERGFAFTYPALPAALDDACRG